MRRATVLLALRNRSVIPLRMTSTEMKRWLAKQGATFAPGKGGHLTVRLGDRVATLPMHGAKRELKKGTERAIRKALGLE